MWMLAPSRGCRHLMMPSDVHCWPRQGTTPSTITVRNIEKKKWIQLAKFSELARGYAFWCLLLLMPTPPPPPPPCHWKKKPTSQPVLPFSPSDVCLHIINSRHGDWGPHCVWRVWKGKSAPGKSHSPSADTMNSTTEGSDWKPVVFRNWPRKSWGQMKKSNIFLNESKVES